MTRLSPASLAFSGTVGGANPVNQLINVTNARSGTLTWTTSVNLTRLAAGNALTPPDWRRRVEAQKPILSAHFL